MKLTTYEAKVISVMGMIASAITGSFLGSIVPNLGWSEGVTLWDKLGVTGIMIGITTLILGVLVFSEDS